jgi:hypothetical protein
MEKTGAMHPTAFKNTVDFIISLITAYPCAPSLCKTASRGSNRPAESSNVKTFAFSGPVVLSAERNAAVWCALLALARLNAAPIK